VFVTVSTSVYAQQKRLLTPDDYGKWESLSGPALSPNGKWLAYSITRVDGTLEVRYREVSESSRSATISGATKTAASAAGPVFSADSKWLAYSIGFSEAERAKLTKENKPLRNKLGIIDLAAGKTTTIESIAGFAYSQDGGYLAMRGYP